MKLKLTACIEAPTEKVWDYLSDVANIHLWVDSIQASSVEGAQSRGVGTCRTCRVGDKDFKERFVAWDEGRSYTYQALNTPSIMKSAQNRWSVTPENGLSLLTMEPEVVFKGGALGKLLTPLMRPLLRKQGSAAMASFKYLVENGTPYEGKSSRLSKAPIAC